MNRCAVALRVVIVLLIVCVAGARTLTAYPPEKPYDPRPLTAEMEKKYTADKYSFVVMGDVKGGRGFNDVVKQAETLDPAFALLTGDLVAAGTAANYDRLEGQFGAFMRKIPSWNCIGNHETGGQGVGMFHKFYGLQSRHFWFDFRNARCICLDAPARAHVEGELKWLEPLLAEGQKAGKLLFVWQHCPPYTVGVKTRMECPGKSIPLTQLCTKYGVVALFAGHDHIYYRTFRDGVTYIIQGLGGAGIYALNRQGEAIEGDAYCGKQGKSAPAIMHTPAGQKTLEKSPYQLTQIQVDGKKVTGRTIGADGEVLDEFTLVPPPALKPAPAKPAPAKPEAKPAVKEPVGTGA